MCAPYPNRYPGLFGRGLRTRRLPRPARPGRARVGARPPSPPVPFHGRAPPKGPPESRGNQFGISPDLPFPGRVEGRETGSGTVCPGCGTGRDQHRRGARRFMHATARAPYTSNIRPQKCGNRGRTRRPNQSGPETKPNQWDKRGRRDSARYAARRRRATAMTGKIPSREGVGSTDRYPTVTFSSLMVFTGSRSEPRRVQALSGGSGVGPPGPPFIADRPPQFPRETPGTNPREFPDDPRGRRGPHHRHREVGVPRSVTGDFLRRRSNVTRNVFTSQPDSPPGSTTRRRGHWTRRPSARPSRRPHPGSRTSEQKDLRPMTTGLTPRHDGHPAGASGRPAPPTTGE